MHGLIVLCFLLPTYLIRFSIGIIPTTLLEITILILAIIWLIKDKKNIQKTILHGIQTKKLLSLGILLFFLGASINIFIAIDILAALGEWRAFYIEPILVFFITITTIQTKKNLHNILFSLVSIGIITSILAIYQHFTGWMVPYAFWENRETFRVTAWYGFPNGVGLFLGPLVIMAMFLVKTGWNKTKKTTTDYIRVIISSVAIPLMILAIIYAKSTGAIIGIIGACGLLLFVHKKTRLFAIVIGIIGITIFILLPTEHTIKQEVLAQDRSGQIRISMWEDTLHLLQDYPITGAGLASYTTQIKPYHTLVHGEGIEIFHHPHNLFLTIWVNVGIIGFIGFLCIIISTLLYVQKKEAAYLCASFIVILIMGLVDSPYIKNDLSILFWLFPALIYTQTKHYFISK